jgi:hypothetical protein
LLQAAGFKLQAAWSLEPVALALYADVNNWLAHNFVKKGT